MNQSPSAWKRLESGNAVFGPNLQIPSPDLVEVIGWAGFDFVMLDGEHGAAFSHLPELLLACTAAGLLSVVRVPSHDRGGLLPPLEMGASAIQVPFVETAEEAAALVWEVKYPPLGGRGLSTVSRAAKYGFANAKTHRSEANRRTKLIVQIESPTAVENLEKIAATPGVDMIFIGPADLAQSYGHPTDRITERTRKLIERIIERAVPVKAVGISAFDRVDVRRWHRAGARYFVTSSGLPIRDAFRSVHAELREGIK